MPPASIRAGPARRRLGLCEVASRPSPRLTGHDCGPAPRGAFPISGGASREWTRRRRGRSSWTSASPSASGRSFVAGLLAAVVFEALHPSQEDPNNNPLVFAEYARDSNWTTVHLGQLAAALLLIGGPADPGRQRGSRPAAGGGVGPAGHRRRGHRGRRVRDPAGRRRRRVETGGGRVGRRSRRRQGGHLRRGASRALDRVRPQQPHLLASGPDPGPARGGAARDRKSTRLNSSHVKISYAVFCLKKKKKKH